MTNEKVAQILKKQFTVQWLKVGSLSTGAGYQRDVKTPKVDKIVAQFNPYLLAPIIVSKREDDSLWVIDGQHRVSALRKMGWHDQEVACQVLLGLTYEEEAALHGYYQIERSAHTPIELFLTFYEARRPLEVGIMGILNRYGLTVGSVHKHTDHAMGRTVSAVAALREMYGMDPNLLDRVLSIVTEAWDEGSDRFQGDILRGVALTLMHYPKTLEEKRLIQALNGTRPISILNKAREQRRINNAAHVNNIAAVIVSDYNHLKGGKKLPPALDLLRPYAQPLLRGGRANILTTEQREEVRREYLSTPVTKVQLAAQYGVSVSTIGVTTRGLNKQVKAPRKRTSK